MLRKLADTRAFHNSPDHIGFGAVPPASPSLDYPGLFTRPPCEKPGVGRSHRFARFGSRGRSRASLLRRLRPPARQTLAGFDRVLGRCVPRAHATPRLLVRNPVDRFRMRPATRIAVRGSGASSSPASRKPEFFTQITCHSRSPGSRAFRLSPFGERPAPRRFLHEQPGLCFGYEPRVGRLSLRRCGISGGHDSLHSTPDHRAGSMRSLPTYGTRFSGS
jgi:hypothetical protein